MGLLKATIIGNIGADVKVLESNGTKFYSFNVAHSFKDKNGVEYTTWVSINYRENTKMLEMLKKGKKVYVTGNASANAYTDKHGNLKGNIVINAESLILL